MSEQSSKKKEQEIKDNELLLEMVAKRRKTLKTESALEQRLEKLQTRLSKRISKAKDRQKIRKEAKEADRWGWFNHSYPN